MHKSVYKLLMGQNIVQDKKLPYALVNRKAHEYYTCTECMGRGG